NAHTRTHTNTHTHKHTHTHTQTPSSTYNSDCCLSLCVCVSVCVCVCVCAGELCDLILVFFDPMGQALCKRTLNIVEQLNDRQGERLRFYLSKADEADCNKRLFIYYKV